MSLMGILQACCYFVPPAEATVLAEGSRDRFQTLRVDVFIWMRVCHWGALLRLLRDKNGLPVFEETILLTQINYIS